MARHLALAGILALAVAGLGCAQVGTALRTFVPCVRDCFTSPPPPTTPPTVPEELPPEAEPRDRADDRADE